MQIFAGARTDSGECAKEKRITEEPRRTRVNARTANEVDRIFVFWLIRRLLLTSPKIRMSARGTKRPLKAYARDPRRRKVLFGVDLNDAPPCDNRETVGSSSTNNSQHAQVTGLQVTGPPSNGRLRIVEMEGASSSHDSRYAQASVFPSDGRLRSTPIDVEALEDELVISSPRRFAAARMQTRRRNNDRNQNNNAVTVVLDDDVDAQHGQSGVVPDEPATRLTLNGYRNQGRLPDKPPAPQVIINVEQFQHPPNPPKEPVFTCAICIGPLVEEHTTICGHIFCKKCIKAAIAAQKKCPTCRRNLRVNNIHRVYLPSIN
ncbi:hypothetical protein H6P81_014033 [Aristolochia fimbriata]|uniref:RING-type domain-containing protein n=1 Tax=Aristolochia fimbriata TaxID=158543 RepID=A0AAV7EGC3_ARIFI|nr:hypothetical protein H6P81_014033 [Aristolochia fimbriata]